MKKQYKLLAVFIAVVLVVCCCSFSALADTIHGFDSAVVIDPLDGTKYHLHLVPGKDNTWTQGVYIPETFYSELYLCTDAKFTLDSSNVLRWGSFRIGLWNYGSYSSAIYDASLVLLDSNYNELAILHNFNYSNIDFWQNFFTVPSGSYSSSFEVDARYIAFRILYHPNANSTLYYYTTDYAADISVVDKATAEQEKTNELLGDITADKYTPPSGDEEIGNLNQTEEELLGSSEEGMNQAKLLFSNFNLAQFGQSMLGVISIVNTFVDGMPWLSEIIIISLSIGILAFLFGIANMVVSKLNSSSDYKKKGGG